jgi:aspartyl-tRNA(Asn)/glutamyl-tRNA(Gln) amidotransferase subunit C
MSHYRLFRYFCDRTSHNMQVTDALVDKIANLAKLSFTEKEKKETREDLEKMIGFVDQLNSLDMSGIEPLLHMSLEINVLRDDEVNGSVNREEALKNAPQKAGSFFTVPKVIQK